MEELSSYDRATIALWARSHRELAHEAARTWTIEAATHALLARLRAYADQRQLLTRYQGEAANDFALIRSVLPEEPSEEVTWRLRDAAFHLRWLELSGNA